MDKMLETMQQAIMDNLPLATANEMRKFIDEAAEQKAHLTDLTVEFEELKEKNLRLLKENEAYRRIQDHIDDRREKWGKLQELKIQLEDERKHLENETLKIRLQCALEQNAKVEELVAKVFGHPSVTVSTFKNSPIVQDPGMGGTPFNTGSIVTSDENTTRTEGKI